MFCFAYMFCFYLVGGTVTLTSKEGTSIQVDKKNALISNLVKHAFDCDANASTITVLKINQNTAHFFVIQVSLFVVLIFFIRNLCLHIYLYVYIHLPSLFTLYLVV